MGGDDAVVTRRGRAAAWVVAASLATAVSTAAAREAVTVLALDGSAVDPFALPRGATAVAFVFLSVDCPVSNRFAPELARLRDEFSDRGVAFTHVYPNPRESASAIRSHARAFDLAARAVRDPSHALVRAAGVTVTPEAAVFGRGRRAVYRGRIDDRFVSLGVERPRPARRDLREALLATLMGVKSEPAGGPAVGCYIADFIPS